MFDGLKKEWKSFSEAKPGERFKQHQEHLKEKSRWELVLRVVLGLVLFAAGVVMLVVPGPGLLGMALGLAMFAGQSRFIATWLDRGEVKARELWGKGKRWWLASTPGIKVLMVALAVVVAASAALVMYRLVLA